MPPTSNASAAPASDAVPVSLCINTVRTLAMDAVQQADSGHPGTPMALAPLGWLLFTKHLKHNPADPHWPDRDRFVLSCGHASMLLYSLLYLTGYDLSLDDLKQFRQWGSRTPGHPELGHTAGVETTTGPLGQGLSNAVGMAVAEAHLAATFNKPDQPLVDHHTWFICSDGDLMEGISHEAASFAGHFKLGKLIGFYDDNHITIDGETELTYTDDVAARFTAYGWHVQRVPDVNDLAVVDAAIAAARAESGRPSLIICRTHIGFGSPNRHDSAKAHGEPLGIEEVKLTKQNLGWPSLEPFFVPDEALAIWREAKPRGEALQDAWRKRLIAYTKAHPAEAKEFGRRVQRMLPAGWADDLPTWTPENGTMASRAASGAALNAIAPRVPELIGGSADLTPSNLTTLKGDATFGPGSYQGRYFHFGIREHGMTGMMNGMALHGGVIPFGGTFLIFSDYLRPSMRLAAMMKQQVIWVFTHDSIGLGEDGPTHQPIEQLSAMRCIPNLTVIRPADAAETAEAWRVAVAHRDGPVALVLTRQKLPLLPHESGGSSDARNVARGAYVLSTPAGGAKPAVVLLSSGSEVGIAVEAAGALARAGVAASVVSMPSHELFAAQPAAYRDLVLPPGVPRVAIEAAHPMCWYRWVGDRGRVIGLDHFGASAPYQRLYQEFGLTSERVAETARALLKG